MTVYADALPCPGTTMECDLRASVSGTEHLDAFGNPDGTGWTITYSLYLYATNGLGYPYNGATSGGTLDVGGTRRITWAGTYNFPSGHPIGYTVDLGSGNYFLPVTPSGDATLAVAFTFDDGGSPILGDGSGSGSLILPHINRAALERYDGSAWEPQLADIFDGSAWDLQSLERFDGTGWVRQK